MTQVPKPSKGDRLVKKHDRVAALYEYRRVQSALAILRDNNTCVFCFFLLGKRTRRDDIHHVYGRGKQAGDWRESYRNLACTCRKHHPLPIQTAGGNHDLAWVEEVMKMANETPINKLFKHQGS